MCNELLSYTLGYDYSSFVHSFAVARCTLLIAPALNTLTVINGGFNGSLMGFNGAKING